MFLMMSSHLAPASCYIPESVLLPNSITVGCPLKLSLSYVVVASRFFLPYLASTGITTISNVLERQEYIIWHNSTPNTPVSNGCNESRLTDVIRHTESKWHSSQATLYNTTRSSYNPIHASKWQNWPHSEQYLHYTGSKRRCIVSVAAGSCSTEQKLMQLTEPQASHFQNHDTRHKRKQNHAHVCMHTRTHSS